MDSFRVMGNLKVKGMDNLKVMDQDMDMGRVRVIALDKVKALDSHKFKALDSLMGLDKVGDIDKLKALVSLMVMDNPKVMAKVTLRLTALDILKVMGITRVKAKVGLTSLLPLLE